MNAINRTFKDEKNEVIVKSSLHLLLEIMRVFKVLEFTIA
jgi:hypothetical protein